MQRNQPYVTIDRCIMQTITYKHPRTVHQLIKLVQQAYPIFSEQEIRERILYLQKQRKLVLKENPSPPPSTLKGYLFSPKATWYWTIVILSLATSTIIFTVPEAVAGIYLSFCHVCTPQAFHLPFSCQLMLREVLFNHLLL